ncbi:hypothetical protein ANANG_G00074920 [Anguilla anguilla]|uniref:Proteasome subunit beta n=1 Tax=Anguilla anguilla TaxID=7936 RepID=A0A9D3MJ95_ANGAN|nr:hypothetical protein ANANG_G00074920 [Anguilla anguilla]
MALQDVCGFRDTPAYPRWNSPASLFMPAGDASLQFGGGGIGCHGYRSATGRDFPLQLYAPGGILAAADTRSSCSGLVACPASQKILPVHSHLVGTTSGTSADCALWKRILARELRLYTLRHRRRPSTGGAAKLLSHMLHPFRGTELCVAATLCGWDLPGGTGGGLGAGGGRAEQEEEEEGGQKRRSR